MKISRTLIVCFTAAMLITLAAAQRGAAGAQAQGPAPLLNLQPAPAQGPQTDLSTIGTGSGGAIYNNRSLDAQHVIPPGGCLILTITGAEQVCLQDAQFKVNFNSIARAADFKQDSIPNSFNKANYDANNTACTGAKPKVTQIYEKTGCVLSKAVRSTTGLASTNIPESFVCESSGVDTTSYDAAFPAEVCKQAVLLAGQAVRSGAAVAASGNPCTASRATYIISNPCMNQNTTINGTARFFLAEETAKAPAPSPETDLAPGPDLMAMAPGPKSGVAGKEGVSDSPSGALTPGSAESPNGAVSPNASAAAAPKGSPGAGSSGASRGASVSSILAGAVGVVLCLVIVD